MKLKYYLRGLGIGILITTIIFIIGIHVNQDQMFSDEEVIRRAKALGMVMDETDGKTINELDKDKKQDSESKDQKDSQKEDSKESKSDNKDKQEQAKDDQTKNDQTKADAESEKTQDSDAAAAQKQTVEQVEVSILPGEYSDTISQKLLDAGLIDDKAAFSKYINDTNVDNLIQPGTFTVPKGASYEEVAKILTTKQENRQRSFFGMKHMEAHNHGGKKMSVISMKQLLEAGVHFGHQTRRWNPKMAPYIYTERNGIYIIDLQKSVGKVDEAYQAVSDIAADGGSILFVGTKKQAQDAIKTEAERCGMYYVNERWLGGMLTNFKTIQSRIERLKAIEAMAEDGTFDVLPKKEVIALKKEWDKLEKNLGGIKDMKGLPDAIFVVDPKKERICVQEAHTLGIPLIGICDTNCDPEELDYVIPGNDDAIRAVKLIVSKMADAVVEANQGTVDVEAAEEFEAEEAEEA